MKWGRAIAAIRETLGFAGPVRFHRSQSVAMHGSAMPTAPMVKPDTWLQPGDNLLSLRQALSRDRVIALQKRQYRKAFSIERDIQAVTHAILGARC